MSDFHIHVYFDETTRDWAASLRETVRQTFPAAEIGRFHERPVGPHPRWSYQIAFDRDLFGSIVPWMARNRDGLAVLVHPNTGEAVGDHTTRAMWMGEILPLNTDVLKGEVA